MHIRIYAIHYRYKRNNIYFLKKILQIKDFTKKHAVEYYIVRIIRITIKSQPFKDLSYFKDVKIQISECRFGTVYEDELIF